MGLVEPIDLANDANVQATGIVTFQRSGGTGTVTKIPTRGHFHFTLTTIKTGAMAGVALLKGTNNPDPADTSGETLITNTHAAADQQDGKTPLPAGYKYVFVHVTTLTGAGAGQRFDAGKILLHGTGLA